MDLCSLNVFLSRSWRNFEKNYKKKKKERENRYLNIVLRYLEIELYFFTIWKNCMWCCLFFNDLMIVAEHDVIFRFSRNSNSLNNLEVLPKCTFSPALNTNFRVVCAPMFTFGSAVVLCNKTRRLLFRLEE